eukprot:GFUD01000039.1.p1 GENE.GFUD01000039.1~~GFUD01000039.1.p1  ORF type:complete len:753 (+),score=169.65 GFUD01000039.1:23-2260(+)
MGEDEVFVNVDFFKIASRCLQHDDESVFMKKHHGTRMRRKAAATLYHQRSVNTILNTNETFDWRHEVIHNILSGNTTFFKQGAFTEDQETKLPMFKVNVDVPVTCVKRKEEEENDSDNECRFKKFVSIRLTTFQFAIMCGNDDLLQLFFKEFESDDEFMEDCVLGTVETEVDPEELSGFFRPDDLIARGNSLHIATMYNPSSLKKLLVFLKRDSDIVREVVDIKDKVGQTALQLAVKNKDTEAASILLDFGANIDTKNVRGRTPLHTCRTTEMVEFLLQNGADPRLEDNKERTVLEHFIIWNPENANALLADFITTNGKQPSEEDFLLIFDLSLLKTEHGELKVLQEIVKSRKCEFLRNPLIEAFIFLKSNSQKFVTQMAFLVNIFFAVSLTWMNILVNEKDRLESNNSTVLISCEEFCDFHFLIVYALVCLFSLILFLQEVLQLSFEKSYYFKSMENRLELLIILLTVILLVLIGLDMEGLEEPRKHVAAFVTFFAWIDITIIFSKWPGFGIYVLMMISVVRNVIQFLMVYFTTFVAFAMSFYLILPSHPDFSDPLSSFVKVIPMFLGEMEFSGTFTWEAVEQTNGLNFTAQIMFILFVIMVSIIINNLLIGLTVSDTKEILDQANSRYLKRIVMDLNKTETISGRKSLLVQIFKCCCKNILFVTSLEDQLTKLGSAHMLVCVLPNQTEKLFMSEDEVTLVYAYDEQKSIPGPAVQQFGRASNIRINCSIMERAISVLYKQWKQ